MWKLQSKRNLRCPTARRLGETSYYANILVFRVLLTVAPKVYTGQSCFYTVRLQEVLTSGRTSSCHAVMNISFRLREDRQLDEHAGSRMVHTSQWNTCHRAGATLQLPQSRSWAEARCFWKLLLSTAIILRPTAIHDHKAVLLEIPI